MPLSSALGVVAFGLLSSLTWGTADFSGGLASRRSGVFGVIISSQAVGLVFITLLAVLWGEAIPGSRDLMWGALAGLAGAVGIAALYGSLAAGQMGINAPLIAVLGGIFPVIWGIAAEGLPSEFKIIGFGVALIAVWLISRPTESAGGPPRGLGLAFLSGLGIGGFFILLDQLESAAVFWPLVASRLASVLLMIGVAIVSRRSILPERHVLRLVLFAGVFDVLGNTFFVLARQVGRLDVATVLSSLYPVATVLLARIVLKERLAALQTVGIVLAMIAIVLIAL